MPRSAVSREGTNLVVVRCAECAREADRRFTIAEHWTWWSDGCGALVPFRPERAVRELDTARRSVETPRAAALMRKSWQFASCMPRGRGAIGNRCRLA
jgi:hypothetical protein